MDWIPYPIELRFKVTDDLNYNKASPQQSMILKINPGFQSVLFNLCYITLTQTIYPLLASLGNFNEVGAQLPRDSERIELNVFNQLLSLQLIGLIGSKAI